MPNAKYGSQGQTGRRVIGAWAWCVPVASAIGLIYAMTPACSASPGELKAFIGRHPFDRVKGRSLFQVPEVRARLRDMLGKKGFDDLNRLTVSPPVEERSGWLVAHGCRPHNCSEEDWAVAINLADYTAFACLGLGGRPVIYAATGRKAVEQPGKSEFPCPDLPDAVPAFERVFPAR